MKLFNHFAGARLHRGFALSTLTCCVAAAMSGAVWADDVTDTGTVHAYRAAEAAPQENTSRLKKVQQDKTKNLPVAAKAAISQGSLTASAAQSQVGQTYIDNMLPPNADYTQVVDMTPGTFSYNPNGPALGQSKTYFRGFSDGNYSMTFDGIPFQDTNSPTHHSWVFFPSQIIGGAVVDRSPGTASTIGPANFGGSINLLSKDLTQNFGGSVTAGYGTWDTRMFAAQVDTGNFGPDGSSNLLLNVSEMRSDGYEQGNDQKRDNAALKYQYALTEDTVLTLFASTEEAKSNTADSPETPTRQQLDMFGNNYYLVNTPGVYNYEGYNFYRVHTDFEYLGLTSDLGSGWKLDNKLYGYDYHNYQFYEKSPTISATSAIDKLNAYHTFGDVFRLSQESKYGVLRLGAWLEQADTNRHQIPSNPNTQVDTFPSKFDQAFTTKTMQPFAEYEFHLTDALHITPGVKFAHYEQDFTQFPSSTIYPALTKPVKVAAGVGPTVESSATYSDWQPSIDVHYMLDKNWSVYAQYAYGDVIPLSSVYDVAANNNPQGAQLVTNPKPTLSKTAQIGTVWKSDRFTFNADIYHINFDNAYVSTTDSSGTTNYFPAGTSTAQGVEAEGNVMLGDGLSLYLNATYGTTKYNSAPYKGQTADQAPTNTEAVALNYAKGNWNVGITNKRIGEMWNNNGAVLDAVKIQAMDTTNVAVNYTMPWGSAHPSMSTKFQFAINNLFSHQNIVGVTPAIAPTATSAYTQSPLDQITITAPRSLMFTVTQNF